MYILLVTIFSEVLKVYSDALLAYIRRCFLAMIAKIGKNLMIILPVGCHQYQAKGFGYTLSSS